VAGAKSRRLNEILPALLAGSCRLVPKSSWTRVYHMDGSASWFFKSARLRVYDTFIDTIVCMVTSTGKTLRTAAHPW